MRETRQSGSEGGEVQTNEPSLPLSVHPPLRRRDLALDYDRNIPNRE